MTAMGGYAVIGSNNSTTPVMIARDANTAYPDIVIDSNGYVSLTKSIKLGDDTRTASAAGAGTLRWNSGTGKLQNSTGSEWQDISYDAKGTQANPGISCLDILNGGASTGNGNYWIKPGSSAAFQAYCYMTGDWPGGTLVQVYDGHRGGQENRTGALGNAIPQPGDTYSSYSDSIINEIKATSPTLNGYIARCHKGGGWNGAGSYCVGFIRTSCTYSGAGSPNDAPNSFAECSNSWVSQTSTSYCTVTSGVQPAYRGFDGHSCPGSSAGWGSWQTVGNQFIIWEHSGGSTYCGGWDTGWSSCEMLIR
jgi:hypothetical protein